MEILMVLALLLAVASMYGVIIILVYHLFKTKVRRVTIATLISVFGILALAASIVIAPYA